MAATWQQAQQVPRVPQRPERVELLAPAGTFEALVAAVENGADAVYLGGQHFNARKFAANFSDEELLRAVDYAHLRGVKVFVTVNTLVFDHEFPDLVEYLVKLHRWGADACIVQDLGVMRAIRALVPGLPIHLSTQATVHNTKGIRFLEDLGAERVILARENSAKEMAQMRANTGAELEQFVHGAMCYCYSGQCLMSSLIGGRSGNRGACAYTCRLPYTMVEGTPVQWMEDDRPVEGQPETFVEMPTVRAKHVLSAKDLNTLEEVPQLIEAGITSFKIEGRMKRPEYVAIVTRAYRNAIDRYYAGNFQVTDEEREAVRRVFNREFTPGFIDGKEKWSFTNWDTPGNKGVRVGTVVESGEGWVRVRLEDDLRVKDGIEILHKPENWDPKGGGAPEEYGFQVLQMFIGDRYTSQAAAGELVELRGRQWSSPGDPVFKTADIEVLERARATYQDGFHRRVSVEVHVKACVGQPLTVRMGDPARGIEVTHEAGYRVAEARSAPLSVATVRAQMEKLGGTPFEAQKVHVHLDRKAFAPLSALNDARREAAVKLERVIVTRHHRPDPAEIGAHVRSFLSSPAKAAPETRAVELVVNACGLPNLHAALKAGAKTVYFSGLSVGGLRPKWDFDGVREAVEAATSHGARLYLASGMVQKDHEIEMLETAVRAHKAEIAGVLAGNHGALQVALEEDVPVVVDWPINVYNGATVEFLRGRLTKPGGSRLERVTASPEITLDQVRELALHTTTSIEVLAHGRHTLMTSEYCSIGHATNCQLPGGSWAPCHDKRYKIRDRTGAEFPLETDGACRMYILNSVELNMIDRLHELAAAGVGAVRLETIGADPRAVGLQVSQYLGALADLEAGRPFDRKRWDALAVWSPEGFTTGHFYRGPL